MRVNCVIFIILISFLTGCDLLHDKRHDPTIQFNKRDYEDNLTQPQNKSLTEPRRLVPPVSSQPETFSPTMLKRVSLTVNQELPLKEIFLTLARQADVNIVIDPRVQGGVTFYGKERRFIDIIKEICQMTNLRYKIVDNMVRIEPDVPELRNYNIQYLALTRENQSRVSIATDVFSNSQSRNNAALDNGSNNLLSSTSKNDFWKELEQNITTILLHSESPPAQNDVPKYSLHRQAGVISIYATAKQHAQIRDYLTLLEQNISAQVLIEAKIVEVNLKDEFKSGINWNSLKGDFVVQSPLGSIVTPGPYQRSTIPPRDVFTVGGSGRNLTALLSFLKKFGTVRTLSSPRLTVMNNQSAVLKVATNQVFFRIDYDREVGSLTSREREHVSSEIQTVPIGLVMIVQPSINVKNGSIIISLRPSISRVVQQKEDPAVSILSKQRQQSLIPEVQVRELDSMIQLTSGQTAVMGGLMEERSDNGSTAVPEISEVPLLGELFKSKEDDRSVTELVIFLRATIVDSQSLHNATVHATSVSSADQHVYETFTKDPRPLMFD